MKRNLLRNAIFGIGVSLAISTSVSAQVVQLPTVGTFNISTSVAVPDGGSVSMGGLRQNQIGSTSRGGLPGNRAIGSSTTSAGVSVHATIIDLDELDKMIRSQAAPNPGSPSFSSEVPRPLLNPPLKSAAKPPRAEYDYLATMSGHGDPEEQFDADNTKYYLSLAEQARQRGHWASVEVYYKLAWQSLPESRREKSLQALAKARTREAKVTTTDANAKENQKKR